MGIEPIESDSCRKAAMKQIPLSQGYFALVDDEDYPLVSQHKWTYDKGYAVRKITLARRRYRSVYMHRILTNAAPGEMVDHRDGNRANNTRANLRICTAQQNSKNRRSTALQSTTKKASRYKGVSRTHKTKDRWSALIIADGIRHHLGSFASEEEAARAYDAKAIELHGEFAQTNFPWSSLVARMEFESMSQP